MTDPKIVNSTFTLKFFGPFAAFASGRPLPPLRSRKVGWILALLALRRRPVDRSWLAGTLRPDSLDTNALTNLRNSLLDLRRALGSESRRLISPSRGLIALDLTNADVDLLDFDDLIERGDEPSLARAVSLYRGSLLEGCVEEWVCQDRAARENAYLLAAETLARSALTAGSYSDAESLLRRAIAMDPLRESLWGLLMEAQAGRGDHAEVEATYRGLRERLRDELNVEPSAGIAELRERLRDSVRAGRLSPHRAPVIGFASSVVSLSKASVRMPAGVTNNAPVPLTRFIGREREIAEAKRSLSETRLLTLTGAGGIGKSRLSLRIAADLADEYPDGVRLVELASLDDSSRIASEVSSALEIRETSDRPATDALVEAIRPKEMLLILDNCEHLIEACANLAERLLRSAPGLRILATSRESLGIAGETVYRVPSLSLPSEVDGPSSLEDSDAAHLFLARAKSVSPGFLLTPEIAEATARICRRLDGIPLALELAAARLSVLTADQIAGRLDDRFRLLTGGSRTALPRHRTLSALIDWSHELLEERERLLLRRLSVFAGGWTLDAAEAVGAGEGIEAWESLDALSRLVAQSLVVAEAEGGGEARYHMLETIRQYARERLSEAGEEEATWERHLDHFLDFAERAEEGCRGPEEPVWLDRLEAERENLAAALDWSASQGEPHLRLAVALGVFWRDGDRVSEGVRRLDEVRSRSKVAFPGLRARLIEERMRLEWPDLSLDQVALLDEAAALHRSVGDVEGEARCRALSSRPRLSLDRDHAVEMARESIRLARLQSDRWTLADVLHHAGMTFIYSVEGGNDEGLTAVRESLEVAKEIGNPLLIADRLDSLSWIYTYRKDFQRKFACMKEAFPYARYAGKGSFLLQLIGRLSREMSTENSTWITCYLEEGLRAIRDLMDKREPGWYLSEAVEAALGFDRLAEVEDVLIEASSMRPESGMVRPICLAHLGLARLAESRGKLEEAVERLDAALRTARDRGGEEAINALADMADDVERTGRIDALFDACRVVMDRRDAFGNTGTAIRQVDMFLHSLASLRDRACDTERHALARALQAARFECLRRRREVDYAQEFAASSLMATHAGEDIRAATLLGVVEAFTSERGGFDALDSSEALRHAERLVRERFGEDDFRSARSAGQAMSMEQAAAYAFGEHLRDWEFL
jgi:predicted ATPase/DNA-binding SARP family transcriptional activator